MNAMTNTATARRVTARLRSVGEEPDNGAVPVPRNRHWQHLTDWSKAAALHWSKRKAELALLKDTDETRQT